MFLWEGSNYISPELNLRAVFFADFLLSEQFSANLSSIIANFFLRYSPHQKFEIEINATEFLR
jgi:hypothetical protein